jgi:hypothetical protein
MIPGGVEDIELGDVLRETRHFDAQILVENAKPRNLGIDDFALVAAKNMPQPPNSDMGTHFLSLYPSLSARLAGVVPERKRQEHDAHEVGQD